MLPGLVIASAVPLVFACIEAEPAGPDGDQVPPVISAGEPSGMLGAGTTQAMMRVTTSEAATCRWSLASSDAFANMPNVFTTTGGTAHATLLTSLADGQSYTRYVRCRDGAGNSSTTSHVVSFSVAMPADVTAPVISDPQPAGSLPAGTRQVSLRVTTNEAATCRYGGADQAYAQLPTAFGTTGGTSHAAALAGLADGQTYSYYVRCQDPAGNASGSSTTITFAVAVPADVAAPSISNGQPSGTLSAGTTQATMSVATNENATCRWGVTSAPYASLPNTFSTTGGISHATSLTGLANGQSYTFYVRCQDAAGNASPSSHVIAFSVAMPADLTPPVISNGLPTGTLAAGTTQATLSVATNEAATCRWGTSSTASYAGLPNAFATTGGTSHSTPVAGLADGQSYAWYVRCADGAGNASASAYAIAFNIATPADQAAPVISNGQPMGTLASGTTQVTMSVTTNEAASCRWGTQGGESYAQMTSTFASTGGTTHSTTIGSLSNGQSYTRYVRCQDATGNANASSYVISFAVASPPDLMPPAISGGQPTGTLPAGTTSTLMSVVTSEAASCRWGTTSASYANLPQAFTTTGGTQHSTTLTGLANGQSYTFYIRCQDAAGNASTTSYTVSFSVAAPADLTPPTISNGQPSGTLPAGTTQATLGVATNEAASCRWGTSSATAYAQLPNAFTSTGGTSHSTSVTGLSDGQSYAFYVRCQDDAGNANGSSHVISFSIATPADVTPPTISNGLPTGMLPAGTTQATMSVVTSETASCRWGTSPTATYATLPNAFATTGGTSHSTPLTSLADGQSYTFHVRCQDPAGNASAEHMISFSVAVPADVTPPVISDVLPTGTLPAGTTQATMSVTTNENASCRWGTVSTTYANLPNAFTTTGSTAHSTALTGLSNGQTYTRYVRCQDTAGNGSSSSTVVSFSVAAPVAGSVEISPSSVVLDAGDTQGFTAVVRDTEGQVMSATVAWTATGGTITTSGSYTAGGTAGQFRVIASVGSVADTANVTIEAASTTGPVLSWVSGVFRLDGVPITRFGLRASNALQSDEITQRLIDALPDMRTHGMQSFSITIQGGRHEDNGNSAFNGFNSDGTLKPEIRARLTALLDASAERDMVPVIVLFYQGRDQELANETAVRNAVTQTMTLLQPWRHAWVNVINEPNHSGFDHSILSTSSGQAQLYQLAKGVDPQRIVYVSEASGANDGFISDTWGRAGIGTSMPAGSVCIEYDRFDEYSSPGIFTDGERNTTVSHAEVALAIPAYFFYHASWHQKADAAGWPRFDKGGTGTAADPGVSFIWNRMRELAGLP